MCHHLCEGNSWKKPRVCYLWQPVLLKRDAMRRVSPLSNFCDLIIVLGFFLYPPGMRYRFVVCVCVCALSVPSVGLRQECESMVLSVL